MNQHNYAVLSGWTAVEASKDGHVTGRLPVRKCLVFVHSGQTNLTLSWCPPSFPLSL